MAVCTLSTRKGLLVINETMTSNIAAMINGNFYTIGDLIEAIQTSAVALGAQVTALEEPDAVTRVTGNASPTLAQQSIFCDTDGGAIIISLPAGTGGYHYKVINCGSSGSDVTVTPDGAETLYGAASSSTLADGEIIDIHYEDTEGWW